MDTQQNVSNEAPITREGIAVALRILFYSASKKAGKEITQDFVAAEIGMNSSTMSRLMNAQRRFKLNEAMLISDLFGIKVGDLVSLVRSVEANGAAEQFRRARQVQKESVLSLETLSQNILGTNEPALKTPSNSITP